MQMILLISPFSSLHVKSFVIIKQSCEDIQNFINFLPYSFCILAANIMNSSLIWSLGIIVCFDWGIEKEEYIEP